MQNETTQSGILGELQRFETLQDAQCLAIILRQGLRQHVGPDRLAELGVKPLRGRKRPAPAPDPGDPTPPPPATE
jgi:hypothetical protein